MSNTTEESKGRKTLRRLSQVERAQLYADYRALPRGVSVVSLAEQWDVSKATLFNVVAEFRPKEEAA